MVKKIEKRAARDRLKAAKRHHREQNDGNASIASRYRIFRLVNGAKWSLSCTITGRHLATFFPLTCSLGIGSEPEFRKVRDFEEALDLVRAAYPIPNLTICTNRVKPA